MNWQPIDTAPKDGTRVLIARTCDSKHVAGYEDGVWAIVNDSFVVENWPTHWMPIPKLLDDAK